MKKFWNLILAICVILGAVACTNEGADISDKDGFSFIATIEHTRADIVNNNGTWQTVWSGNDTLYVTSDKGDFSFTNSAEEPSRFVSMDTKASVLRDATNIVITTQHENGSVVDSDAGKRGLSLRKEYERFPENSKVNLDIQSAFFRLACDYDVTIMAEDAIFSGINGSNNLETDITLKAGDDIWVAFKPCAEKTSITVMVADRQELVVEDVALKPCVIYNLGEIVPGSEPKPEPEDTFVYLVPNDEWKSSDAWFAAYLFNEKGYSSAVKLNDEDSNGIFECQVPTNMESIIFCRMNPAYTEFAWNSDTESDRIWAHTADLVVGVAPYNYYYITGVDSGEWNRADYDPNSPPEVDYTWAVSGTFNNWGDTVMSTTSVSNIFVKCSLSLKAGDKFKIKTVGGWGTNFGGGITNLMPNMWMSGVYGGKNIVISKSGDYDIYFDSLYERIYLMEEGVDYTYATEQNSDGEDPSLTNLSWGLCGTHNNWGNDGVKDTPLMWDETLGLYVSLSAELTGEFKVRANNTWGEDYGCDCIVLVDNYYGVSMLKGGGNCLVSPGVYDVYFDLSNKLIWVMTPGSEAPKSYYPLNSMSS